MLKGRLQIIDVNEKRILKSVDFPVVIDDQKNFIRQNI